MNGFKHIIEAAMKQQEKEKHRKENAKPLMGLNAPENHSKLWDAINDLRKRVEALEKEECKDE